MTASPSAVAALPALILREYDIRGEVPNHLSVPVVRAIGRAFGSVVARRGGRHVAVGRDGRLSSPDLQAALADGLADCGLDVSVISLGPTPMLYYADVALQTDAAIMVTGSHNPAHYNGLKLVLGHRPFFSADIKQLGRIVAESDFATAPRGRITEDPVQERYCEALLQQAPQGRALDVVWDCGNGATGHVVNWLAGRLPGKHTVLYGDIDGRFPNHHPDPTEPNNLEALIRTVRLQGAECGIAFDGDGDRIGVVDGSGRILWGDQLLLLFAEDLLRDRPGATVIADVKASRNLFDGVTAAGGRAEMHRTGHSLIKTRMKETGALLAGEMSGHLFFADRWYGFDDAIYAAIRLLGIMSAQPRGWLTERIDALPKVHSTPEIRIPCPDDTKFAIIARISQKLRTTGAAFIDIDGIRATVSNDSGEGWWLLRASNTEPALVARCEAASAVALAHLIHELRTTLTSVGLDLP